MDYDKLIEQLKKSADFEDYPVVASFAAIIEKKYLREAATALSTLQAENEKLKDQLYDGEGVNLVNYWMQQAKIEENGHRNCQAENEKLRAELERVKKKNKYSAHDVALILSDAFGDSCACNFNGNDEWLPEKCELLDTCPDVVGVACWEQYLKWLGQKED